MPDLTRGENLPILRLRHARYGAFRTGDVAMVRNAIRSVDPRREPLYRPANVVLLHAFPLRNDAAIVVRAAVNMHAFVGGSVDEIVGSLNLGVRLSPMKLSLVRAVLLRDIGTVCFRRSIDLRTFVGVQIDQIEILVIDPSFPPQERFLTAAFPLNDPGAGVVCRRAFLAPHRGQPNCVLRHTRARQERGQRNGQQYCRLHGSALRVRERSYTTYGFLDTAYNLRLVDFTEPLSALGIAALTRNS